MIKKRSLHLMIITVIINAISGCVGVLEDPSLTTESYELTRKPYELGQCTVIRQEDANRFEVSKQALIGKRYAIYSKAQKDSQPQGPFILSDIALAKLSEYGSWWQVRFNGQPIDVAETFIETSAGTFENLIVVQSQFVSGSCDPQALKFQKKLLLN